MPDMIADVFNSNIFEVASLTASIEKLPVRPARLGEMGLFTEEGVPTTSVVIEERQGLLTLLPTAPRGGPASIGSGEKRTARTLMCAHIPYEDAVLPDDVLNVRRFGSSDALEGVASVVNSRLARMKAEHEVTREHLRVGAVKGIVLDADGVTVLYNLFTEFGVAQTQVDFELDDTSTEVQHKCITVKRAIEDAMGGTPFSGVGCICGQDFFDDLITHTSTKAAYARWQNGELFRGDPRKRFEFAGIMFEEYRATVGGVQFVADDEAHFFPTGSPGLFVIYFGPADFNEAVGTIGLPLYAKSEPRRMGRGIDIHTQSNPLPLCLRPNALILGKDH